MTTTTRGLSLNNPMNMMESPDNWNGQVKPTRDPQKRLAQFVSMEYGLRAGIKNLLAKQLKHNLRTIRGIIGDKVWGYAPPYENDTEAYIADLCGALHVKDTDPVNLLDAEFLSALSARIIHHEQGSDPLCPAAVTIQRTAALVLQEQATHMNGTKLS